MERGEDWEQEAVRKRWALMRCKRRVTKRLIGAFILGIVAVVFFLLAITPAACAQARGMNLGCIPLTTGHSYTNLIAFSIIVFSIGLWLSVVALRIELECRSGGNQLSVFKGEDG